MNPWPALSWWHDNHLTPIYDVGSELRTSYSALSQEGLAQLLMRGAFIMEHELNGADPSDPRLATEHRALCIPWTWASGPRTEELMFTHVGYDWTNFLLVTKSWVVSMGGSNDFDSLMSGLHHGDLVIHNARPKITPSLTTSTAVGPAVSGNTFRPGQIPSRMRVPPRQGSF